MPHRPILFALTAVTALAACGRREPDFDERYKATNARISEKAAEIDARITASGTPQTETVEGTR